MDMDEDREVSFKEAEQLAYVNLMHFCASIACSRTTVGLNLCAHPLQENKVMFFEVSAYMGKNVTESLTHLAR